MLCNECTVKSSWLATASSWLIKIDSEVDGISFWVSTIKNFIDEANILIASLRCSGLQEYVNTEFV